MDNHKGNIERAAEETPEQKRKKERQLEKQIITVFVILALVFAGFLIAYNLFKPKPYFNFEGMTVYNARMEGIKTLFYIIPISGGGQRADIVLRHDPRTLGNISVSVNESLYGISQVWVTIPPEYSSDAVIAANDIGSFTSKIGLQTNFSLTNSSTGYAEITCENATKETRVFLMDLGNETQVFEDKNCIIIRGENYESLVKASDALVFNWLLKLK